jgi:hypothetical protein
MGQVEKEVKAVENAWVEQPTALQAAEMWGKVEAKFESGGGRDGQLSWTTVYNRRREHAKRAAAGFEEEKGGETEAQSQPAARKRQRQS